MYKTELLNPWQSKHAKFLIIVLCYILFLLSNKYNYKKNIYLFKFITRNEIITAPPAKV